MVLNRIRETISRLLEESGTTTGELQAIGIGCPGMVDTQRGVIHSAPNLGWKAMPLAKELKKKFNTRITLLNDVDAGLYGEYRHGPSKNNKCVIGIFPGTGIGGSCIYQGDIIRGEKSSAFEIGHMIVQPDGPLCSCGQKGCLEVLSSRLAVASAVAAAAYRGAAPYISTNYGFDISKYGSGVLAESIRMGDRAVLEIVKEAGKWIGKATATMVNLFAPETVIIGGGMVEAMPEIFTKEVEKYSREYALEPFRDKFKILAARLGDNSVAMGAAAWAIKK